MKKTGSFKIIIPLDQDADQRLQGMKASTVSKLARRGFDVPDGFCVSTDAYRSHLWAAGVRALARGENDGDDRWALRNAITENGLPPDVLSALETAYKSIGDDIAVSVRHSASDENIAGKAYVTLLDVKGLPDLIKAIKEVWASLWSDEAALLRERLPERLEPTMAVLIQRMVDAHTSGVAVATNPNTGNPNEVHIRSVHGKYTDSSPTDRFAVDLTDFSIISSNPADAESDGKESLSRKQIVELAEAAVWVDMALGMTQITQWVHDGRRFLILGAWPAGQIRPYFPVTWQDRKEGIPLRQLICSDPTPNLIQSLSVFNRKSIFPLPSARKENSIRIQNGRPYRCVIYPWEAKGKLTAALDVIAGSRMRRKWRAAAKRIVRESRQNLDRPVQKLSDKELIKSIEQAMKKVELSAHWFEATAYPATRFPYMLKEFLASVGALPDDFPRLLMGHDPAWLERDTVFQRLAAYTWQAKDDDGLTNAPEEIASEMAKRLGYAFESNRDAYWPTSWQSWAEDRSPIHSIAEALARGPIADVELAQTNARTTAGNAEEAVQAAIRASRNLVKRPLTKLKFRLLLRRARTSIAAQGITEQVHALALSALRVYILELGRRLVETGELAAAGDVFHLSIEEIARFPSAGEAEKEQLQRSIAERKHSMWLQQRLTPLEWLPPGADPAPKETVKQSGRILIGKPISPGVFIGQIRVLQSSDDAGLVQPNEILVVCEISPAWTPLLGLAGGLIMSRGDHLSRGAIASRNYNIPCVSEIKAATTTLLTGQVVRLDGARGTIEIVKRRS